MNDAQLLETVATAAARAALIAASGGTRLTPPKVPATPKPVWAHPVRPKPPRREPVDRDRLSVAVHEAGHAVAGVCYGAELHTAVLAPAGTILRGGLKGEARFRNHPHGTNELIAYAGPFAEGKFAAGGRRPTQRQMFDLFAGTGCRDAVTLSLAGGTHVGAAVKPVIERCWPSVLSVARTLYNVGEATREDVLSALGVTDGGGIYSVQLAAVRSGCRSVPAFQPA